MFPSGFPSGPQTGRHEGPPPPPTSCTGRPRLPHRPDRSLGTILRRLADFVGQWGITTAVATTVKPARPPDCLLPSGTGRMRRQAHPRTPGASGGCPCHARKCPASHWEQDGCGSRWTAWWPFYWNCTATSCHLRCLALPVHHTNAHNPETLELLNPGWTPSPVAVFCPSPPNSDIHFCTAQSWPPAWGALLHRHRNGCLVSCCACSAPCMQKAVHLLLFFLHSCALCGAEFQFLNTLPPSPCSDFLEYFLLLPSAKGWLIFVCFSGPQHCSPLQCML